MIDKENEIFSRLSAVLKLKYPKLSITSEYTAVPPSFPHVCIEQVDSKHSKGLQTTNKQTEYIDFTIEVNAYSNKRVGKKSECKGIISVIDDEMFLMNMTRVALIPVPNLEDTRIYRLTGLYKGQADENNFYRS